MMKKEIIRKPPNLDLLIESLNVDRSEIISRDLLINALTHKSIKHDLKESVPNNERLEYLGDAILKLSVSQWLYLNYPEADEGVMSQSRAYVVSDKSLANIARKINLHEHIILGKKEELTGGKDKDSILANCFEAVLGAIFLSTGYNISSEMIIKLTQDEIKEAIEGKAVEANAKDVLQKITQAKFKILPEYNSSHLDGPPHRATFQCTLKILDKTYYSTGASKKEAEQESAKLALKDLQNEK